MAVGAGNTDGDAAGPPSSATLTGPDPRGAPAAAPLRPGDPRQVGGYLLLGRLGEGGMGTVFLGRAASGRLVAVKVIRAEYARDDRFRARFRAEAHAAQRVARFCTAQVLHAATEDELAYLVTEYIDGPTLTAAVTADGPLQGSMLDSLAIGVASALNGIHAAGVVHRDLKPSNVLLSRVGPKVIDFGIARALDALESHTDPGQVVGTPAYMAPEQFGGTSSPATDVFTWGAVVTFAGTGRPPFGSGSPLELMRRAVTEEPDLHGLEPPLRDLVARALSKEPARRPTARALLLALVGEAGDPVSASSRILSSAWTPPSLPKTAVAPPPTVAPTRVEPPARRRLAARAIGIATAVAVLVVAALLLVKELPRDPNDGGARPGSTTAGPTTAGQTRSSPVNQPPDPPGTGADPSPISFGSRVPASGFVTLGIGEVHRYRFRLTAAGAVTLRGLVESCAHLIRWAITKPDGSVVVPGGQMSCRTDGPIPLPAGDYVLRLGDDNVGGRYAFQLDIG